MNEIDSLKKRVAELEKANRGREDVFNVVGDFVFTVAPAKSSSQRFY
jgi:hypothetical protein